MDRHHCPRTVAFDPANNHLFVADFSNARVLVFSTAALANGMNASYELGQPSGTAFTSNTTVASQSGMNTPYGLVFDPANNRLFVTDPSNKRVTEFVQPAAACANPPGVEADMMYNQTSHVMQYCDGAVWQSMKQ